MSGHSPEKAKFCKKFAAGFSNCCKDSGWGPGCGAGTLQQRGKRRWPKRKKDKLTVSIGEFCSKKRFWGFARRKRSYCQFDSKTGADRSAAGKKRSAAYRFWRRQQS
uniref:IncF plasmid conjugative transfer protein TraN n=1 Tax=Klebsiella pneumoniae TaxID=573 RepID=A0A8B0SU19_KLEPN|nr:IncF plasmid conjugative transfer protein TraN [Klebsiella pneumoniae]